MPMALFAPCMVVPVSGMGCMGWGTQFSTGHPEQLHPIDLEQLPKGHSLRVSFAAEERAI